MTHTKFQQYLKKIHKELGDTVPDNYSDWTVKLTIEELRDYINQFIINEQENLYN